MTKYEVILAYNISCYAHFEIEAESEKKAIDQAAFEAPETSFEPAWDSGDSGCAPGDDEYIDETYRLVDVIELIEEKQDEKAG